MMVIRTRFPNSLNREIRVVTLRYDNRWFTFAPGFDSQTAESLYEAGENHLRMSHKVKEKLESTGICGTSSIKT